MAQPGPQARRFAAFLSYSHQDAKWAAWVHRSLERYRPSSRLLAGDPDARARLKPVFRDREELPSAGDLGEKITLALARSRALVVVCSPACARSRWTNREILEFKRVHGEASIFCLIVDGEPGAGDDRECFPPALRFRLARDGTLSDVPAEPIAADLRPGKDGRQLARLKLIAGLLGVELDDLRQREQQRRNRKLLAITTASIAGMALTGALAIAAMVARDDAERRQQQAEALVEFMLGDLKTELGKVGRLDALDAAAREAEAYFSALPENELDDEALAGRAKAYIAIGEIHFDRMEWEQALATYGKALETNRALNRRNPESPAFLYGLAQSEFWVGYVHLESGDPAAAEPFFRLYLDHSRALLDFDAENPDWVMEVSYGHSNLAGVYERTGRLEDAIHHAAEGVRWNRKAAALAPDDPYYRGELAGALDWLSRSQMRSGQLPASAETRLEARRIYAGMLASNPGDRLTQQRLAASLRGEAWAVHYLGDHARALALLNESLDHFIAVSRHDPTNELWAFWARDTALDWLLIQHEAMLSEALPGRVSDLLKDFSERGYGDDALREARRLLALGLPPLLGLDGNPTTGNRPNAVGLAQRALGDLVFDGQTELPVHQEAARFLIASLGSEHESAADPAMTEAVLDALHAAARDSRNPTVLSVQAELAWRTGQQALARKSLD
ncbi:MAG: hypothetical protein CMP07_01630 [Xanthomonadales bacterium]|nr:hypothetical protein [Xanthomonadales bacterium]